MKMSNPGLLVLTGGDDVAVARGDIAKGQQLFADGLSVTALADIPACRCPRAVGAQIRAVHRPGECSPAPW